MADVGVANTSPIIVLARASRIELLRVVAERIVVPLAVADEIRRRGPEDPAVAALSQTSWITVVETRLVHNQVSDCGVDPGEMAVLTWALVHPEAEAILDDLPARRCAERLGIRFRGTVGIILWAKQIGVIPAARPVIEEVRRAGLYLSEGVVAEALARVNE